MDKLINKAREDILNIYINCEKDFQTALELFNTIAEVTTANTNKRKKQNLLNKQEELLTRKLPKKENDLSNEIILPVEETKIELPIENKNKELPVEEKKPSLSPDKKREQLQRLENILQKQFSLLHDIELQEQKI